MLIVSAALLPSVIFVLVCISVLVHPSVPITLCLGQCCFEVLFGAGVVAT